MTNLWGESHRRESEHRLWSEVESPLWILNKLATISACLCLSSEEPRENKAEIDAEADKLMRKVRFFVYDLQTYVAEADPQQDRETDKVSLLRDYFFNHKAFRCRPPHSPANDSDYLLPAVLSQRYGSPLTIGVLFCALARSLEVPLDLVVHEHLRLVKFVDQGRSRYLDLADGGVFLGTPELIDLLNGGSRAADALETLQFEQIELKYLHALKRVYQQSDEIRLLQILNMILQSDSKDLKTLGERALLKDRLGQPYEALLDLKRYFAFYDEHQAPLELVNKYRDLRSRFTAPGSLGK